MKDFKGMIAVVTGGGLGIGRALTLQLSAGGCHVAICDVSAGDMAETQRLAHEQAPASRVTTFVCDVSDEAQVLAFRDAVVADHATDHINLLINNAGIGGGGSFLKDTRGDWERTFGICWYGVYYGARAFMPLLVASKEGYIVNVSSQNGFWAALMPDVAHTAYSAAKFAVKGFTEGLITDLRLNAPHVKAAVVMPGHIGTSIAINTGKILGRPGPMEMSAAEIAVVRQGLVDQGLIPSGVPDEHIRAGMLQQQLDFRDKAPTSAAQAASIILDGVRNDRWRILVGDDAKALDERVRATPELAYDSDFLKG